MPFDRAGSGVGQEVLLDDDFIRLRQHGGAASLADELGGPLDHAMALAGLGGLDVAIGRHLEALLGARLRLHLGHFARFRVFGAQKTLSVDHGQRAQGQNCKRKQASKQEEEEEKEIFFLSFFLFF